MDSVLLEDKTHHLELDIKYFQRLNAKTANTGKFVKVDVL